MDHSENVSIKELLEENGALKRRLAVLDSILITGQPASELGDRLKIEEALAACSHLFAQPGEVDMVKILGLNGRALGAHRATIYQFEPDSIIGHYNYEWCAPGTPSRMQELKTLDFSTFPWSLDRLVRERIVNITDTTKLPPEAGNERGILLSADVLSMLVVPIYNGANILCGWMGFADLTGPRIWKEEDIICMRIIAQMIGIYWERIRAEEEILHRLVVEESIADCSRLLVGDEKADYIQLLEIVGRAVNVHRVCIYEYTPENTAVTRYEWCSELIEPLEDRYRTLDFNRYPWAFNSIRTNQMLIIENPDELSVAATSEKEILQTSDVKSMLAVPIWNNEGKLKAFMGYADTLASRKWMNDDLRCLHIVAEMVGGHWERVRAEQEIRHRLAVEEAIADCSRLLVSGEEVDFIELLSIMGHAVEIDRVCIYEYTSAYRAVCRYEWFTEGKQPVQDVFRSLDLADYSWAMKKVINDDPLIIDDPSGLPFEALKEKNSIQASDIKSLLAVPIWDSDRNLKAFMGYGDTRRLKPWASEDLNCLKVVAEMVGAHWERVRAQEQILHRLAVEEAIAEASRCFLQTEEPDIYQIIKLIGTAVKANRAYVFEINEQTGLVDCTYEWCDENTASHMYLLKDLGLENVEWWANHLLAGETIVIPEIDWGSPEFVAEKELLSEMDAKSLVMVPIFSANHRRLASLGFDDVQGRKIWLEEDIRCLKMVGGMLGAYWERRENEKALRHSEAMFRSLAEITPAFTYITNMQPVDPLLFLNSAVSTLSGYSPEEIANMNPWNIYHPDDRPMLVERGLARMRGEEVPRNYEVRFIRKDGSIGYGLLNSAKIEWEGETAIITVVHDITDQKNLLHKLTEARDQLEMMVIERTSELIKVNKDLYMEINERKQIEKELRKSEANFKKLAEASPALIYVIDEKNARYINSAGENMIGYTREQIVGQPFDFALHDDYKDIFEKFGRARLNGQYIPPYEIKLVHRDGNDIWGILSGDIIEYEGSRCNIGAILDITEYKKMEEELIKRERLETLGLLAGGIAHDFNNILTVISGNASLAQMVQADDIDNEISSLLDDIKTASLQATRLTNQLLTFSKGGAPVKQSLPVQELVMESAKFALAGSGFKCTFSFAEDLWVIDVDREQMGQVISHLVSNACQAMHEGGDVRIEVENLELLEACQGLEQGKYVKIAVIDQGHGIDEALMSKIFNPYYTTRESGQGMGLAVTESIVRRHGGSIMVKPNHDKGTTFEVYIPASGRLPYQSLPREAIKMGGHGRILVMDDEEYIRIILGRMLKKLGYEVYLACDGQEAIEYYTNKMNSDEPFDAVIMDLTIPGGMGGSETIAELLKIDPAIKAIVSSGYSSDPVMANYQEYGFCGVIPKPYEISKLNQVLHEVLFLQSA